MSTEHEYNEWTVFRWMDDAADKKRVLLIGDSIVCGHGEELHEKLKAKYCVDHFATSKIVCDTEYWDELQIMLFRKKYDMIIFNNGLHGCSVDDQEYASGLQSVIEKLKKFTSVLVWRNNTPCFTLDPEKPNEWEKRVPLRNAVAEEIVKAAGLPVLDAFSLLKDHKAYSLDGVHFKPEGYEILINAEAELIEKILG